MLKMELEEFIEEVKGELYGYEEIEEAQIVDFEKRFRAWVADKKAQGKKNKNDRIKFGPNSIIVTLKDESDLFKIVDRYLAAVVDEETGQYWENWSI
ncbi:hypothetical protein HZI73_21745 [Vallitalea pronyensis]|uniref:Uncharacterized protein n=1 Tax=Vallitalea pronyensis TaxID=1348613 RepID=A0A8J8SIQ7_9FIRM|nr:hypothetical protein [Vallitalea pronyensis]QUI24763.1 hypothetical protein HZI73_21745 [Vallitalea pronyensis]